MSKKIDVFLRLGFSSHPVYEDLFKYPPEGVNYIFPRKITKEVHYTKKAPLSHRAKLVLWNNYTKFFPCAMPEPEESKNCDLIHSTNNVMMLGKKPWVMDAESGYGLLAFKNERRKNRFFMYFLNNTLKQESFKFILAWSKIAERSINTLLKDRFKKKIVTVYPAHRIPKKSRDKENEKLTILFDARRFEHKGGYELLRAFGILEKKYDLRLNMISLFPDEIIKKYSKDKNINLIKANLTREKVLDYYMGSDVFVYPTHIDTFGYVFLQAMAYKMPIVTTRVFATPEIVGKAGFLIDPILKWTNDKGVVLWKSDKDYLNAYARFKKETYVKELVKKISILIENKRLRKEMAKNGFREIENGKFSIERRNTQLREIYARAIE